MANKQMVVFYIVVTVLVVGLLFYAGKHAAIQKQVICFSKKTIDSADQMKGNIELTKLIVTFGNKTVCSKKQPVFHTKY